MLDNSFLYFLFSAFFRFSCPLLGPVTPGFVGLQIIIDMLPVWFAQSFMDEFLYDSTAHAAG